MFRANILLVSNLLQILALFAVFAVASLASATFYHDEYAPGEMPPMDDYYPSEPEVAQFGNDVVDTVPVDSAVDQPTG